MKSRVIGSLAVLAAFFLGLATYHPIAQAVEEMGKTTCSIAQACVAGQNKSNGPGTRGSSSGGSGANGQTTFVSKSGSSFAAGVYGQDLSSSGKFDVGVWGQSKRGEGVYGSSNSAPGVAGYSNTSSGVNGVSKSTGVYGVSNGGSGSPTGVWGQDSSASMGQGGVGVYGRSNTNVGGAFVASSSSNKATALLAQAPNGAYPFAAVGAGNTAVADIDPNGNLNLAGEVFTSGSCASGCARHRVRSYASTAATPTLEDTGEAQLRFGTASVRLDPAFANAADLRQGYFVLITPESETHGTLYVAQRTAAGFEVRENMGGRSNGSFAYRIVAHPYGANNERLPFVTPRNVETPRTAEDAIDHQQ